MFVPNTLKHKKRQIWLENMNITEKRWDEQWQNVYIILSQIVTPVLYAFFYHIMYFIKISNNQSFSLGATRIILNTHIIKLHPWILLVFSKYGYRYKKIYIIRDINMKIIHKLFHRIKNRSNDSRMYLD